MTEDVTDKKNPVGRPLSPITQYLRDKDKDVREVLDVMIAKAKEGDTLAGKLILERSVPIRRDSPLPPFDLPQIKDPDDCVKAAAAILEAVAAGLIAPSEGDRLAAIVEKASNAASASKEIRGLIEKLMQDVAELKARIQPK